MQTGLSHKWGFVAVLVLFFGSCAKTPVVTEPEPDSVRVPLALSVGRASGPAETKMTADVTQLAGVDAFRGIERVYVIPFKAAGDEVAATDTRWSANLDLPQVGLPANTFGLSADGGQFEGLLINSNAHLYDWVHLKLGTNSVLVYGKAKDEEVDLADGGTVAFKHRNGVLLPENLEGTATSSEAGEIGFSLESIMQANSLSAFQTWRSNMLNYLGGNNTGIIGTSVKETSTNTQYFFNNPESYNYCPFLKEPFDEFTNEGRMVPLSDKVWNQKLTTLYQKLYPYSVDRTLSAEYRLRIKSGYYYYVQKLAEAVCAKILKGTNPIPVQTTGSGAKTTVTLASSSMATFGLPEGTVAIQYREGSRAFGVMETFSGMATLDLESITYPPSLWYFVNSPVISSEDGDVTEAYKAVDENAQKVTWPSITQLYNHVSVTGSSEAAAIQKPVQYGVALMTLSLKPVSSTSNFFDAKGNKISVNHTNFPLTGVIVGDQHRVGFDFSPESNSDIQYIYDSEVNTLVNGVSTPLAYLTSKSNTSKTVSMLVLETPDNQPVHFALEFKNATKSSFFAADGCEVYPGSYFYLLGILKMESASVGSGSVTENLHSVFAQDHETKVNAVFSSLINSYSVLPSLDDPQLVLGVKAEMSWDLSDPAIVPVQ